MEDEDGSTPNQSRRYKKIKNVQLIPPDSPEIVDHFIHSFTPPEGWERMPTPKKSGHRSMIYEYGVKCKRAVVDSTKEQLVDKIQWFCMACPECRETGQSCFITVQSTSNATSHLRSAHGVSTGALTEEEGRKKGIKLARKGKKLKKKGRKSVETVPPDPYEIIEDSIANFEAPEGFQIMPVPNKTTGRSAIYDYGVKVKGSMPADEVFRKKKRKSFDEPHEVLRWYCLATEECRRSRHAVCITPQSTSNAMKHLTGLHKVGISAKKRRKRARKSRKEKVLNMEEGEVLHHQLKRRRSKKELFSRRSTTLNFVKAFTVQGLAPLTCFQNEGVYRFLNTYTKDGFLRHDLQAKEVQHQVLELYGATRTAIRAQVASAIENSVLPPIHLNVTLWECGASNETYMGIQISFLNGDWLLHSYPLAYKKYEPSRELIENHRVADAMAIWMDQVLIEFGLERKNIFATVTGANSELTGYCRSIFSGSTWECCLSYILSSVMTKAFGMTGSSAPETRALMIGIKNVIVQYRETCWDTDVLKDLEELVHACTNVAAPAATQWSSIALVFKGILLSWSTLETFYHSRGLAFPLGAHRQEILELYSLMEPVVATIRKCHARFVTGPQGFLTIASLVVGELSEVEDLPIFSLDREDAEGLETNSTGTMLFAAKVPHHELTLLAQQTREQMNKEMRAQFLNLRYVRKSESSHLFDLATAMHPSYASLNWVDELVGHPGEAHIVKEQIDRQMEALLIKVFEAKGTMFPYHTMEVQGDLRADFEPMHDRFANRRSSVGAMAGSHVHASAREAAEQLHSYKMWSMSVEAPTAAQVPFSSLPNWWKTRGSVKFPELSVVAKVLLSVPASTAQTECDFSNGSSINSIHRESRYDAAIREMLLFLHGVGDVVPSDKIPRMDYTSAMHVIPERLRLSEMIKQWEGLGPYASPYTDIADT